MQLPAPVTVAGNDGPITVDVFDPIFIDDPANRRAVARIAPGLNFLTLWRADDYDAAGDWTQAQAEARILALLADDPQGVLQSLVPPPRP